MLSVLLLVILTLCNAQWSIQNIGHKDESIPQPRDQPGQVKGDASEWVENVPNSPDIAYPKIDSHQRARIPSNLKLKFPEADNQKVRAMLSALEIHDNSESVEGEEKINWEGRSLFRSPLISMSPALSKIVGNMTLSRKSSVRDQVTDLVNEGSALRNDTDQLVDQLNLLYLNLATDEADNEVTSENAYKYGMSVILRFLFEFYRIFRKLSSQSTQTPHRLTNVDVYAISYEKAVDVLKEKKSYSPLAISAPIRRSFDIFKSILYESVIIIQTKCSTIDPNWKCIIVYLANLITETMSCSNVWYHAFVHMLALENVGSRDSYVYRIANLDTFKELTYFENIFEFIIEKIQEYREIGRVQLSAEAVFFTMLADLQENGLLDCMSVDYLFN